MTSHLSTYMAALLASLQALAAQLGESRAAFRLLLALLRLVETDRAHEAGEAWADAACNEESWAGSEDSYRGPMPHMLLWAVLAGVLPDWVLGGTRNRGMRNRPHLRPFHPPMRPARAPPPAIAIMA